MPMEGKNILYIKNMVCPRCVKSVSETLTKLNVKFYSVTLGEVVTEKPVNELPLDKIAEALKAEGFELLESKSAKIIERIKVELISVIQNYEKFNLEAFNISNFLKEKISIDYSSLSALFSKTEGITIEHFFILQKIEKVKELLKYNELTLSEIAYKLGYSSVGHLSNQFKKVTGMTASQFKAEIQNLRKPIDSF